MTRKTLRYVPEEDHTRVNRDGVWADEFVEPWAWRRGHGWPEGDISPLLGRRVLGG